MPCAPRLCWYKPRSCWTIRIDGKRRYFPGLSKPEAQRLADLALLTAGYKPETLTLGLLIEAWAVDHAPQVSESGRKLDRMLLRFIEASQLGPKSPDQLSPLELRRCLKAYGQTRHRVTINRLLRDFKRVMNWGLERELISFETAYRFERISPLRPGETGRESNRRRPPTSDAIQRTRRLLTPHMRAVLDLMLLTGARCGELLQLQPNAIDRAQTPWVFIPPKHKTKHLGKHRAILLNVQAREIVDRIESGELCLPRSVSSFRDALQNAASVAGVEAFTPHQLRHKAATEFRAQHGLDAARLLLGHATTRQTEDYSWTLREQLGHLLE